MDRGSREFLYTYVKRRLNGKIGSYFDWLTSFIEDEEQEANGVTYDCLLKKLWSIPYRPSLGNDLDRAEDGIALRQMYDDIVDRELDRYPRCVNMKSFEYAEDIYGDCRVLEMLVALSMRMCDIMQDTGVDNSVSRWFWEIMENVAFDILHDDVWFEYDGDDLVERHVNRIMDRDIRSGQNGRGGWFYVRGWTRIEIWYQMHNYLKPLFIEN